MKKRAREQTQYLRVVGRVYPDNRMLLKPGYLTEGPAASHEDESSSLAAEMCDSEGRVLSRFRLPMRPYGIHAKANGADALAVRAKIPFPDGTRLVRFVRDDIRLHQIRVSEGKPTVRLRWKPPKRAAKPAKVSWSGAHPEKLPLFYFLRYSHDGGKTWRRVTFIRQTTEATVPFDALPGGTRCRLEVTATDGVNTTRAQSAPFSVPVKPCAAFILEPQDKAVFPAGRPLTLIGQGFWLEEGKPELQELEWSSQKGKIGRGRLVGGVRLPAGSYTIRLLAGKGPRAGRAEVEVRVEKEKLTKYAKLRKELKKQTASFQGL